MSDILINNSIEAIYKDVEKIESGLEDLKRGEPRKYAEGVASGMRSAISTIRAQTSDEAKRQQLWLLTQDPESVPLLDAILALRRQACATFTPEFSGLRFEDYDRAILASFHAVRKVLEDQLKSATEEVSE